MTEHALDYDPLPAGSRLEYTRSADGVMVRRRPETWGEAARTLLGFGAVFVGLLLGIYVGGFLIMWSVFDRPTAVRIHWEMAIKFAPDMGWRAILGIALGFVVCAWMRSRRLAMSVTGQAVIVYSRTFLRGRERRWPIADVAGVVVDQTIRRQNRRRFRRVTLQFGGGREPDYGLFLLSERQANWVARELGRAIDERRREAVEQGSAVAIREMVGGPAPLDAPGKPGG